MLGLFSLQTFLRGRYGTPRLVATRSVVTRCFARVRHRKISE